MKTTQKNILVTPRLNGKAAPSIAVEIEGQMGTKEALAEAKSRSGLARFEAWEFTI